MNRNRAGARSTISVRNGWKNARLTVQPSLPDAWWSSLESHIGMIPYYEANVTFASCYSIDTLEMIQPETSLDANAMAFTRCKFGRCVCDKSAVALTHVIGQRPEALTSAFTAPAIGCKMDRYNAAILRRASGTDLAKRNTRMQLKRARHSR